ncbi:MAG: endonuclease IV [Chlamydiae bacterium SM23_39]|nr:MAG: endonuclease IV [Chlamydiae bacterium SM23_39]
MKKPLLVGAHMSATGGVHNALYTGQFFKATVIQLFTTNQRRWAGNKITKEEIALWEKAKKETKITHIMSHDSYLINLGSPKKMVLKKSIKAFSEELIRCQLLQIDYLTFHPGSALNSTEKECLDTICKSLLSLKPLIKKKPILLLETTAGQGSNVGYKFEHLAYIIKKVKKNIPIGVCIDTCHIFAAGYDIRTKKEFKNTLKEFDEIIGLNYLYAFHVNDSVFELGSRRDRHASLGMGKIGLECFKFLMTNPKTKYIPKYLETPLGDKYWKDEIKLLKHFGGEK